MSLVQWNKIVSRLRKYRVVKMPDGNELLLWENGDVSLRDSTDGHCIICTNNLDEIKRIYI